MEIILIKDSDWFGNQMSSKRTEACEYFLRQLGITKTIKEAWILEKMPMEKSWKSAYRIGFKFD